MSHFNGAPEKAKRLRLLKSAREHMCSMHMYCTSMYVLYMDCTLYMYMYMYSPCARVGTVEVSMADCCTRHGSADHTITLEG